MPTVSSRHFILTSLQSSFHTAPSPKRCFLIRFSSNKISLPMAESNNNTANSSSLSESQQRDRDIDANVISDNPLSDISHDEDKYFMVGTIPVPLHKKKKNSSLLDYEQSKFKRRIRGDLEMGQNNRNNSSESSFRSSFDDNNSSNISPTKISHHNESPRQSHFSKKDDTASADRRYNKRQRKFNYDICFRGKRNSSLTGATLLEKNKENCIEFEMPEEEGTNEVILRPGMVLLKQHLTHHEQVSNAIHVHYSTSIYYSLHQKRNKTIHIV